MWMPSMQHLFLFIKNKNKNEEECNTCSYSLLLFIAIKGSKE
jgi:hypothetical protein